MKFLTLCFLIERVRTSSHRRTQMNRTHKGQKDDGPSPFPSPEGKGSDYRDTPMRKRPLPLPLPRREGRNHRDTPMANHQHLTTITQHPSLAVTFCDICMPEAFCGIETVRKWGLLHLWVLWEKEIPSVREKDFLCERERYSLWEKRISSVRERTPLHARKNFLRNRDVKK